MEAKYGESEIRALLQKVQIFNHDIGAFEVFAITENFDYAVKLSNGKIHFKLEELQDDARNALTPERLAAIANRFVTSTEKAAEPPKEAASTPAPTPTKKKSNTGKAILILVIIVVVVVGGIMIYDNSNSAGSGDSYHEKIMTVEQIERSQPTNFLSASGTYKENFWGTKFKVKCVVTNTATKATYKDAVVRVTYYSKTKTVLTSNQYTIYETFAPNSTKTVELEIKNYKDVNSIGWNVVSAKNY